MTIVYPYPVAYLSDVLRVKSVTWDIQRNDEMSGDGRGSIWQAELAPPLWLGTIELITCLNGDAKQISALIRKLHGMQEAFLLVDPLSRFPQADPKGALLGSSSVSIASVSSNRDAVSFAGFPPGYRLLAGDKFSVVYGSNPTRFAFFELSEAGVANSAGVMSLIGVFPHVPTGVSTGLQAVFAKPFCRCVILPGTHNPGTAEGLHTSGMMFKAMQKR